ncbi:MAG TPA: MqnA/MqnD/SBP family protein [Bacteroidota bacterium]|nr:MqnA/MqnD/SBP family protein [Bacteroidota bacterium]
MAARTLIGMPSDPPSRPLEQAVRSALQFEIVLDSPAALALRLERNALGGALLSPIDYARNASEYLIVPGSAVSSHSGNESIVLHFRPGVRTVRTLAVQPVSASDIILARIILTERFDLEPQIVPVAGGLREMLAKADAALLAGDLAATGAEAATKALDLVEEWIAATDLPYVHGFWCAREKGLGPRAWSALSALGDVSCPDDSPGGEPRFAYDFPENVQEGIREFLRYAYYHGILPDVPDLRFFGAAAGDDGIAPPGEN